MMASHVYEVAPDLEALQGGLAMAANEKTGSPQKNDDTSYVAVLAIIYTSLLTLSTYALFWVPQPLDATANAKSFSEGRALYHVDHLSKTVGDRLVGTKGAGVAANYVQNQAEAISSLANQHRNLRAIVDREEVSGSLQANFAGVEIASSYTNLTNIVLYIEPKLKPGEDQRPALLLNSHFDTVFGSHGASDCASCVGVMLEVARALIANPDTILDAPLVFLFNGGEEALLLAAHGFMKHSKWASKLGAFINLESTGPGGPAYLFQHTGGWTVEAYGKASKFPHGSVCGQDFFDTRILAMDTDFRMFSSQHYGNLPGIDIAYILDGAAYHTKQDTLERIRKGTVQANGENILSAIGTFTQALKSNTTVNTQRSNAVYFDILGRYLVTYSWELGKLLHTAPLALLITIVTTFSRSQDYKGISYGRKTNIMGTFKYFAIGIVSIPLAILFPALFGGLRAFISGRSMIWFGKPFLMAGIYGPLAFAGMILPQLLFRGRASQTQNTEAVLGFGLVHGLIAALLTSFGAKSGYMSAMWAFVSVLSALVASKKGLTRWQSLIGSLVISFPAGIIITPFAIGLPIFVMEHISISGSPPAPFGPFVGDIAVGGVVGLAAFVTGSFYTTWLGQISRKALLKCWTALIGISILTSIFGTILSPAYSKAFPKRVVLQHLHELSDSGAIKSSHWAIAAMDPIPITKALPNYINDLQPSGSADFVGLFPLSRMVNGIRIPAPYPSKNILEGSDTYLNIQKIRESKQPHGGWRILLELQTSQPAWGTLNITGHLLHWSFTDKPLQNLNLTETKQVNHIVRFAGNDKNWQFWVDCKVTEEVEIKAAVLFMEETEELKNMIETLPDWTNPMPFTGFQRSFKF